MMATSGQQVILHVVMTVFNFLSAPFILSLTLFYVHTWFLHLVRKPNYVITSINKKKVTFHTAKLTEELNLVPDFAGQKRFSSSLNGSWRPGKVPAEETGQTR